MKWKIIPNIKNCELVDLIISWFSSAGLSVGFGCKSDAFHDEGTKLTNNFQFKGWYFHFINLGNWITWSLQFWCEVLELLWNVLKCHLISLLLLGKTLESAIMSNILYGLFVLINLILSVVLNWMFVPVANLSHSKWLVSSV